jgi:hypothetical protein
VKTTGRLASDYLTVTFQGGDMRKIRWVTLIFVLVFGITQPAYADNPINGVTPTQGHASGSITAKCYELYSDKTYIRSYNVVVDFWNVGKLGGEQYQTLTMTLTGVGDNLDCFLGGTTLTSTFEGGPNGIVAGNGDAWKMKLVDGRAFDLTLGDYSASIPVENPEIFDGWVENQITSEYIYTTYGIRVEDSFGDNQYTQKAWSDHELVLLNDVLKGLPPGFIGKISLDRIVRSAAFIEDDGTSDPNVFGAYFPCDRQTDAKCNGSKPTIRVFDQAQTSTLDFPGDHDRQFKATILHEIIHAYQYNKDGNTIYKNPYNSPQTENYLEATRPLKGENAFAWRNGWKWYDPPQKWTLFANQNDIPPTNYGTGINPLEDMSESAMMYVFEPARLKASSPARYDYIRSNIFGGVEYDNGNPK